MAQNLIFISEVRSPNKKIVVLGPNHHLRHNKADISPVEDIFPGVSVRTAGASIKERFGAQLFTVRLNGFSGKAANNSREIYEMAEQGMGSCVSEPGKAGPVI